MADGRNAYEQVNDIPLSENEPFTFLQMGANIANKNELEWPGSETSLNDSYL